MTSRHCPHGQHSIERLFSSIFRRIRKGPLKGDRSKEDAMHVTTDAEIESTASTSSGVGGVGGGGGGGGPQLPDAETANGGGGGGSSSVLVDDVPSEDSGDSPLPDFLTLEELHQHRVKPGNLQRFSERLTDFVQFVQRVHDLARATYDHPAALQRRLDRDLAELRALLAAVRDAVATVQRLRAQRAAVRKEKAQVRKHLRKLREEEVREMESIVAVYDKAMYARWENVRHTHKVDALNALLNDVKGKQQAMENLCVLIQRKQVQLQGPSACVGGGGLGGVHGGDRERTLASAAPALNDAVAAAAAAAAAASAAADGTDGGGGGSNKRHVMPGSARTVALRRRRHHERQWGARDAQSAAASACGMTARWEPDISMPLALPAPTHGPLISLAPPAPAPPSANEGGGCPAVGAGAGAGPGSVDGCGRDEGGGGPTPGLAVSSPSLPQHDSPSSGAAAAGRGSRSAQLGQSELHEMRGVLQALFSDLRLGPVANIEDIDLFTVRSSQASNPQ